MNSVKQEIETQLNLKAYDMVMGSRTSWKTFDNMRKMLGLVETKEKVIERKKSKKEDERVHGYKEQHLETILNATELLDEAKTWGPTEKINWTNVGRRYGLLNANKGQIVKEYLASKNIPAALLSQRTQRQPRRAKAKLAGGRISHPMFTPSVIHKKKIQDKIDMGELLVGIPIVENKYTKFSVDKQTNSVIESTECVYGQLVPIIELRHKLLKKHESLNIVRAYTESEIHDMTMEQTQQIIKNMKITLPTCCSIEEMKCIIHSATTKRYLKLWHDHSEIAGHGHLLCTVTCIYDPGFFYTSAEMKQKGITIDVEQIVEAPEIYILARSSSSIEDETKFNQARFDDLPNISTPISTLKGVEVTDILRYFHADGPARQFECGNNIGGYYPCSGCGALSTMFDDIAYSYRTKLLTIEERQSFILKGEAWKLVPPKPLDDLLIGPLRKELQKHGVSTKDMKRAELDKTFQELRMGINNFPALLYCCPNASLESLHIDKYEISPLEPLHDLKGHISHLLEAAMPLLEAEIQIKVHTIIDSVLGKETKRCSDYRKALVLIDITMQKQKQGINDDVLKLFSTCVEIQHILYSKENERTDANILRLYNLTYMHATICNKLFPAQTQAKHKVYGCYFHSIICHAPTYYRLISLRSLNTEYQERIFKQSNAITKGTSNMHPANVIKNALVRIQEENRIGFRQDTFITEENAIGKLATDLETLPNSFFSHNWINDHKTSFQAHLERISDYLLAGPGKWWKKTTDGIEFLDKMPNTDLELGSHFRSNDTTQVTMHLHNCWEQCLHKKIELPLNTITQYTGDGIPIQNATQQSDSPDIQQNVLQSSSMDETDGIIQEYNTSSTPVAPGSSTTLPETLQAPTYSTACTSISANTILQTKLAQSLMEILPNEQKIISDLDEQRYYIKTLQNQSKIVPQHYLKRHKTLCCKVKTIIQKLVMQPTIHSRSKKIATFLLSNEFSTL